MIDWLIVAFLFLLFWTAILPVFKNTKKEQQQQGLQASLRRHAQTAQKMEGLLRSSSLLPMTDMLCAIILGRKLRSLAVLKDHRVSGSMEAWEDARRRYHDHRGLITSAPPPLLLPTQEPRRRSMQQAANQLLTFLKSELASNPHHPEWVRAEIQRITEIDIELSVDADLHQARNAITVGREGSARQFLTKARDTLMRHPHAAELQGLREDVITMLNRYNISHHIPAPKLLEQKVPLENTGDGLDRMFGEKQGW